MSRQDVRNAVASWITAAAIPNVTQVLAAHPKRINFEVGATPGQLDRAAVLVFIADEIESRIAVGGAYSGWKRVDYTVDVQVFHHSGQPLAEDAMTSFDNVMDALKTQLRGGGHRLNMTDGSVIWQAAEPGVAVTYGEPLTNNGGFTEIWASARFTVTQMIQA